MAVECGKDTGTTVYVNSGINSDSKLRTDVPELKYTDGLQIDSTTMHDILSEARVVKNDEEILAMRWASQITAESHCNVLRNVKAGQRESQIESFFNFLGQ